MDEDLRIWIVGVLLIIVGIIALWYGFKESILRIVWNVSISPWIGVGIMLVVIGVGVLIYGKKALKKF